MDDVSANIFNYCIGAFALCSTLASIYRYYRSSLPGKKVAALQGILVEIREIYEKATVQDLFPSDTERIHAYCRLHDLETLSNELREKAYASTTAFQEFVSLIQGLSKTIAETTRRAKILRGTLLSTTEEKRRIRDSMHAMHARSHCPLRNGDTVLEIQGAVESQSLDPGDEAVHEAGNRLPCSSLRPSSTRVSGESDLLSPSRTPTVVGDSTGNADTENQNNSLTSRLGKKISYLFFTRSDQSSKTLSNKPTTYPDAVPPV